MREVTEVIRQEYDEDMILLVPEKITDTDNNFLYIGDIFRTSPQKDDVLLLGRLCENNIFYIGCICNKKLYFSNIVFGDLDSSETSVLCGLVKTIGVYEALEFMEI